CLNVGGIVFCNLGSLAAGGSATVRMVLTANAAGVLTNAITLNRAEADGYLPNNSVAVITEVNFALLSITAAIVSEGDRAITNATFSVRLSAPCRLPVSVDFATSN